MLLAILQGDTTTPIKLVSLSSPEGAVCLSLERWINCANSFNASACVWGNAMAAACTSGFAADSSPSAALQQQWIYDPGAQTLQWAGDLGANICLEYCTDTDLTNGVCSLTAGGDRNVGEPLKHSSA